MRYFRPVMHKRPFATGPTMTTSCCYQNLCLASIFKPASPLRRFQGLLSPPGETSLIIISTCVCSFIHTPKIDLEISTEHPPNLLGFPDLIVTEFKISSFDIAPNSHEQKKHAQSRLSQGLQTDDPEIVEDSLEVFPLFRAFQMPSRPTLLEQHIGFGKLYASGPNMRRGIAASYPISRSSVHICRPGSTTYQPVEVS